MILPTRARGLLHRAGFRVVGCKPDDAGLVLHSRERYHAGSRGDPWAVVDDAIRTFPTAAALAAALDLGPATHNPLDALAPKDAGVFSSCNPLDLL